MAIKTLIVDESGNALELFVNTNKEVVLIIHDGVDRINGYHIELTQSDIDALMDMLCKIKPKAKKA